MKWKSRPPAGNRRSGARRQTITIRYFTTPETIPAPSRAALTDDMLDEHSTRLAVVTEGLCGLARRRDSGEFAYAALVSGEMTRHWHAAVERRAELRAELAMVERDLRAAYVTTLVPAMTFELLLDSVGADARQGVAAAQQVEVEPW